MHLCTAGIAITQGSTPALQALILSQDSTKCTAPEISGTCFLLRSKDFFNSIVHVLHPPLHPDSRDSIAGRDT
jgi:hypothetical protein